MTKCGHMLDPYADDPDNPPDSPGPDDGSIAYRMGPGGNQPWACTRKQGHTGSHYCFRAGCHLSIWDDDGWLDVSDGDKYLFDAIHSMGDTAPW